MRNRYWTIKYRNGWLDPWCISYTRSDAIAKYLEGFQAGKWKGKSWKYFYRAKGVRAVKVTVCDGGCCDFAASNYGDHLPKDS